MYLLDLVIVVQLLLPTWPWKLGSGPLTQSWSTGPLSEYVQAPSRWLASFFQPAKSSMWSAGPTRASPGLSASAPRLGPVRVIHRGSLPPYRLVLGASTRFHAIDTRPEQSVRYGRPLRSGAVRVDTTRSPASNVVP